MMKNWKMALSLCLAFFLSLSLPGTAAKPDSVSALFVAPSGSDRNPGSKAAPFQTIQKAVDAAVPGTTVYVRKGTYREQVVFKKSGARRSPITLQAYPKEKAVLDGTGVAVSWDDQGLVSIQDASYITIQGLELRNYKTKQEDLVPAGIFISGSGKSIQLLNNHIHHIETLHDDGNAHGIAVYGTKAPHSIEGIRIAGNTIEDLKLGASEGLVLNGNVSGFHVSRNVIRRLDNIGIDVIGFEGVAPEEAYDQARNGVIRGNAVSHVSSYGNPAYGNEYSAGGIYVDGGKNILIEQNKSYRNDIGIEAASEHAGKSTSGVVIRKNILFKNRSAGIAIGGYDPNRGSTTNSTITDNVLFENDTGTEESGQLLLQFNARHNKIERNKITAGASNLLISSSSGQNRNQIDYNTYKAPAGAQGARWIWEGSEIQGFSAFKSKSRQDEHSSFLKNSIQQD